MATNPLSTSTTTIAQLESARNLALGDARYYNQILLGILPLISGANIPVELQRWGADFIAEAFANPVLLPGDKQTMAIEPSKDAQNMTVIEALKGYLETSQDAAVVRSVVQAAASVYPLVFRHTIVNPSDTQNWQVMAAIKSNILRRMDSAPPGVRICCIKFVQRVIQVETPGLISDPRRPEQNEISLALVPRDHPLLQLPNLEAEASGLLDRLLDILQSDISDALLVTATLNSLGTLVRCRPVIANKIISAVLNFNPFKLANSPLTSKSKVMMKAMERTGRALLVNLMKREPGNPFNARIQQYVERMARLRIEVLDDTNRKRPAPSEPTDGFDPSKRPRLEAHGQVVGAPPPGPVSFADLYTLTHDAGAKSFDVQVIPIDTVVQIIVPMLMRIDKGKMDDAINTVRARLLTLSKLPPQPTASLSGPDDDDYEPDFAPREDAEQLSNKLANAPPEGLDVPPSTSLAPFKLPQAPPITEKELEDYGNSTIRRVFDTMNALSTPAKKTKPGFNRCAASSYDREAWMTIIARLATRAGIGLGDEEEDEVAYAGGPVKIKSEGKRVLKSGWKLNEAIREMLYQHIMADWRRRIDFATSWLSEEWYNDRISGDFFAAQTRKLNGNGNGSTAATTPQTPNYTKWVLKLLDSMLPYLESNDKGIIRFLSEIPAIDEQILTRVKRIAEDPERVGLTVNVLHYLILFRPPVREMCVGAVEDLWRNYDGAKTSTRKLLLKWRPEVLQEELVKAENAKVNGEALGVGGPVAAQDEMKA
ncbi:uncharacterized protein BDZ99DRAFT_449623 [Mytilinidion resinicola]|uniref:Symplekin/Pta1 N-terminal domain-containing protein n=1 Tax=Mytilinidion resinicola TaxID=574789 RepID=A0A6A6YB63_9PEZI|nr:uncharacterized protein BDZ99DRAFT_449623 [Mytilinidion resinicola]KAF2805940.1 hypothetical protein BDZ99DRAFT_449623 [Mytilinidion resinicola]